MAEDISDTLAARGVRYGSFEVNTKIMQDIKDRMRDTPNWRILTSAQKEALDMLAHKMGRILGGDPNFFDSWHDISGYATLVANTLKEEHHGSN